MITSGIEIELNLVVKYLETLMIWDGGPILGCSSMLVRGDCAFLIFQDRSTNQETSHWSTILLPFSIPPVSNGWTFQKVQGWELDSMAVEEELTDEEEMSDNES